MKKIILLLGIVFISLGIFAAWFTPGAFIGSPAKITVQIIIPKNADQNTVSKILVDNGVISSAWGYKVYAMLDSEARQAKAGTYSVYPGQSYRELARALALGPARNEVTIKLIEGTTARDEEIELEAQNVSATSACALLGDSLSNKSFPAPLRLQFPFLKNLSVNASLEGYLFPDTYRVFKDQLPLGLVLKQLANFADHTQGYEAEALKQGRSLNEVVTLASIVEKEGRGAEERRIIAGILLNRLKIGMRLQADSTINYATKANRARVSLNDLEINSPYNTYKNDGLPPGPICNPSAESLEAALHPAQTNYIYYLHDAQGKIYYAKTLEEHKANRYKAYGE